MLVGGLPVKLLVQPVYCRMAPHHYALGSVLMHFIFSMVVLVARIGGCAFIGHPAFPTCWERAQVLILDQCI